MLSKKFRLSKDEATNVARRGKRINMGGFYIRAWFDENLENSKFAVVVPKKVDKRATVRNRIKRIFRAAIISYEKKVGFKKGMYFFYVHDVKWVDATSEDVGKELIKFT